MLYVLGFGQTFKSVFTYVKIESADIPMCNRRLSFKTIHI